MIALGLALGIALLSRAFGFVLLAGVLGWSLMPARERLWRSGLWLSFVIAALAYAPFLMWNVTHEWANVTFSLYQRHEVHAPRLSQLWPLAYGAILMYSPGLWLAAICVLSGLWFVREPLVAWTAIPLAISLTALASFETVEQHWYLGVYASLCVAMGLCYARTAPCWRRVWGRLAIVPALGMLLIGLTAATAPAQTYAVVRGLTHLTFRNDGPFGVYVYRMLAGDIAALTARSGVGVMTTSYGLAAELSYHSGLVPVVIGADYRGRESRRWPLTRAEGRMIVVERAPLSESVSLQRLLAGSCRRLTPGPVLYYRFAGAPARSFYTSYCIGIGPREIAALRAMPFSH
jgi:4-amino-4-deoxy-L-arabinose transferase-like glycosyltransferase